MLKVKVKKIGGSIGLFVKKDDAKFFDLKDNEEIIIDINRSNPLRELFGSGKFSKPTKQLLKESRKKETKYW